MDIPRSPRKRRRSLYLALGGVAALGLITAVFSQFGAGIPSVDREGLWVDTVRRGDMTRSVRGPGTLSPERIRFVSAVTAGRVERVALRAGANVLASTVLLELSNPDVQLQALEAERMLSAAHSALARSEAALESDRLTLRQQYDEARRAAEALAYLGSKKLASEIEVRNAVGKAEELRARLALITETIVRQLALQRRETERLTAIVQFHRERIRSMLVKAGEDGQLQHLDLELGQWVVPGQLLAKIAQPGRLKAILRIPETHARDIAIGQRALIDTHNGIASGRVVRVDPAAENGTVGVEVGLEGELPRGARADLSVDGTVELEHIRDVLQVGRPAYGQPESIVEMFRLERDGKTAVRVNVGLGRSSSTAIEIVRGLSEGDKVIISDVTAWDSHNRLRFR